MNDQCLTRTTTSQTSAGDSRPKLLQMRHNPKRPSNNKITIYSNKYTSMASTQATQEDNPPIVVPQSPAIMRLFPEHLVSSEKCIREEREYKTDEKPQRGGGTVLMTPGNKEGRLSGVVSGDVMGAINSKVEEMRVFFERRVREVMEENGRVVGQLRQRLNHTQRLLSEKQDLIGRLLQGSRKKEVEGEKGFDMLNRKIVDLEKRLQLLVQSYLDSQDQLSSKVQNLTNNILVRCSSRLKGYHSTLSQWLIASNSKLQSLTQTLTLKSQQHSQQQQAMGKLQAHLHQLSNVIATAQQHKYSSVSPSPHRRQYYYDDDEDEFFYPSSDKKQYHNDYEPFHPHSDEDQNTHRQ